MKSFIKFILIILFVAWGCSTTKIIKHETETEFKDVTVKNDTSRVQVVYDLYNQGATDIQAEQTDTTKINLVIPKKTIFKKIKKKIKLDKNTSVDINVSTQVDSGKLKIDIAVPKIQYQEKIITNKTEIDTTPKYTKWIIVISILAFIAIIIIVIKLKS